ncbi:MAG TPA: phosphodiester glycosidase family protein, partial [Streptosporangiaceae bacterium]
GAKEEHGVARPIAPVRRPGSAYGRPTRRRRSPRRSQLFVRVVLALVATFVFVTGWSVTHALTYPGGGTVSQRVAEWARNHYLGPLVTFGEWLSYNPPKRGGKPPINFNKQGGGTVHKEKHYYLGIKPIVPANLASPAGPNLPGEGVWKVAVSVHHDPAVFKTYLRQSKTYSSYYVGIASMDQRLLKFDLRPGTEDPGYGNWGAPMDIPSGHRLGLVATFNSGFRVNASGGGFYLNGHYDGSLVNGEASEVFYKNGQMTIGTWGRGPLHMGPTIAGVRQNLKLIVSHGQVPATVDQNVLSSWGATLGGGYNVWRSAIGISKDGHRLIYVYGAALDVRTLADLLKRAGAYTGMELDINPDWMSFMYYLPKNNPANPTPVKLLGGAGGQIQPADRYYYISNRDFTAVFSR